MAEVGGLQEFTAQLISDLREEAASFAVVGGFAVSVRTEPRFTRDINLAVAVGTDADAEALVRNLQSRGYEVFMVLEQEAVARLATVRLRRTGPGGEPFVADLLFASSGIEVELVEAATEELLPGVGGVPVATCGYLIALKVLSRNDKGRPNDVADLHALLRVATPDDLAEARNAMGLIERRGFHRKRDLLRLLDSAIEQVGDPYGSAVRETPAGFVVAKPTARDPSPPNHAQTGGIEEDGGSARRRRRRR